jgi:hypothetical protein
MTPPIAGQAAEPTAARPADRRADEHELHVVPLNDLIEHDTTGTCTYGPTDQPMKRDDGSVGWLTIHHSIDGREANE